MILEMAPRFAGPGQVAAEDKGRQSRKGRQEGYGVGPILVDEASSLICWIKASCW